MPVRLPRAARPNPARRPLPRRGPGQQERPARRGRACWLHRGSCSAHRGILPIAAGRAAGPSVAVRAGHREVS